MEKNVVIAGYARSPFHFAKKGSLATMRPDEMAGQVVKELMTRTGVEANDIEDLIMGCAFPEGEQGFNIGRLVAFLAGFPQSVAGATVNRFCGSSMQSIHMAAGAIQMNAGDAFICAGIESMTRIPMGGFNPLPSPKLYKELPAAYMGMGETAENVAKKYNLSRADQEAITIESHKRAANARKTGLFKDEIVPITLPDGSIVSEDGCIREGTNAEGLAGLKPAFSENGTVTAATSSPLTDGCAATLITSEEYAKANGLDIIARIKSIAVAGCAPEIMGIGPVAATKKAMKRAGVTMADIDIIELNEAFASQTLACIHDLGIDFNKTNIDGGALALGHPLGATGARITAKAAQVMKREGKSLSLATQCIGGGQGIATILEAV